MKLRLPLLCLMVLISTVLHAEFSLSGKIRTLRPVAFSLTNMNGDTILTSTLKSGVLFKTETVSINEDYYILHLGNLKMAVIFGNNPITIKGFLDDKNPTNTDLIFEGAPLTSLLAKEKSNIKIKSGEAILKGFNDACDPLVQASIICEINADYSTGYEQIARLSAKLNEKNNESLLAKKIGNMVSLMKQTSIGSKIQSVDFLDQEGKLVSLSDFAGKLILLDFWASWCGPCRAEIKSLKKIYEEIKGNDLVFISVSLDEDKAKWLKALDTDNIPWVTLWDNRGMKNSDLQLQFGFSTIPFIALIGKDGNLLARQLRGENVRTEIEKYRKK